MNSRISRRRQIQVLVWSGLLESVRRKDLYVVALLSLVGMGGGAVLAGIGVRGFEIFFRDVSLAVINTLSVLLCVWLACRQFPEELQRKTLFPLLARPVRRFDVLTAKLVVVWLLSGLGLTLMGLLAALVLAVAGASPGPIFGQFLLLRFLSFGPIGSLSILLSLLTSPAAAVIVSALLALFGSTFGRTLADAVPQLTGPEEWLVKAAYFTLPHLDLFDLAQRTAYAYPPIPAGSVALLIGYSAAYTALFLAVASRRFQGMRL